MSLEGSSADLCSLVRSAAADGRTLCPRGGGTILDNLPRAGTVVDMTRLDQVIDYPARDMTITVQAGITIAWLAEVLHAEGQRLPVDVPLPRRATLGGAVAANASGPRRYGYGTLRDYVIGISVVNDRGEEVKAGGRVVKNVAGYDLCKLFVGSLGTLGIITQLTLKVRPLPEASVLAEIRCGQDELGRLLDTLHGSQTRPVAISALSDQADHWRIFVGFEETEEAVAWQRAQLDQELAPGGSGITATREGAEAARLWQRLTDFPLAPPSLVVFKANLLPRAVAAFCAQARPQTARLLAHAGNGIVFGHLHDGATLDQAKRTLDALRAAAVAAEGNLVIMRCPDEWKPQLKAWGEPRGDWVLMQAVKRELDPKGVFGPLPYAINPS
jgi:glycolate oxidase FAD binding subunit